MDIRQELEKREELLHPGAARSNASRRAREEKLSPVRTEFQRDRDRILHSKAFRRLKHKTQVLISPEGDHFRTRLTHTLEVSQIARTIAKALNLNEDLTEAIALGHDLGHTPFGHMGEKVIHKICPGGFRHYEQSLRVVDFLEYDGKGLNLTDTVRDGILKHSKGQGAILPRDQSRLPRTLEGQIVRISDIIAYVNHDLDDALRARLITDEHIPGSVKKTLGHSFARRIDTIVIDVIAQTIRRNCEYITISDEIYHEIDTLRLFLSEQVYFSKQFEKDSKKIQGILMTIYDHTLENQREFINSFPASDSAERRTIDFIAGMTDRYALNLYRTIVFPTFIY